MPLGNAVHIRFDPEIQAHYEAMAAAQRLPLGTFLRERLETADKILGEFAALREFVARPAERDTQPRTTSASDTAILLEVLLLLRQSATPAQRVSVAQAEVARQGLTPWKGS